MVLHLRCLLLMVILPSPGALMLVSRVFGRRSSTCGAFMAPVGKIARSMREPLVGTATRVALSSSYSGYSAGGGAPTRQRRRPAHQQRWPQTGENRGWEKGWDRSRDRDSGEARSRRDEDGNIKPRQAPVIDHSSDYLYGIAPVLNALAAKRRALRMLYVQEGLKTSEKKDKKAVDRLLELARDGGLQMSYVDKHTLNLLSDNRPHQGFVLQAAPLEYVEIDSLPEVSLPEGGSSLAAAEAAATGQAGGHWLVLDEVWDPQNMGALLRSAYFLGMKGVVVCAKNSARLSPVVSKASAGALEVMPVHSARNLVRFLESCRARGYSIMGTSLDADSKALADVQVERPTVLVLGNEGYGVRTNVMRACNVKVRVEGGGELLQAGQQPQAAEATVSTGLAVDSLNVSVTGGILMHYLMQQQAAKS